MKVDLFLDASYAIALSSSGDAPHNQARALARSFDTAVTRIVTTQAVLLEIANALSRQRYRSAAVAVLESLAADSRVEVVPLSQSLYDRALRLFRDRPDKDWGLTDCISFVVMGDRGLTDALMNEEQAA